MACRGFGLEYVKVPEVWQACLKYMRYVSVYVKGVVPIIRTCRSIRIGTVFNSNSTKRALRFAKMPCKSLLPGKLAKRIRFPHGAMLMSLTSAHIGSTLIVC